MRSVLLLLAMLSALAFAPAPLPRPPKIHRVEFRPESMRLGDVFRWLAEQTGKPIIGSKPAGTLTFIGSKQAKYSIPDIIVIINRNMEASGLALVERERCFVIVPREDVPAMKR